MRKPLGHLGRPGGRPRLRPRLRAQMRKAPRTPWWRAPFEAKAEGTNAQAPHSPACGCRSWRNFLFLCFMITL